VEEEEAEKVQLQREVDQAAVLRGPPEAVLREDLRHNQQQIQGRHLPLHLMDLLVEMVGHIHQSLVLVVAAVLVVLDKQELQQLEVTVDLVFNFLQHSKIQYLNLDQMVEV
jgi:hypothetical protein